MKRFKTQVEKAVRPIRAGGARKDRMREELYGHLWSIYEQELDWGGDKDAAEIRAVDRFGDPAELRRELQASVPMPEQVLFVRLPFLNRLREAGVRRLSSLENRSALRHATRSAMFLLGAVAVVAVIVNPLIHSFVKARPDYLRVFIIGSTIGGLAGFNVFFMTLLNVGGYFAFRVERLTRAEGLRVAAYGLGSGLSIVASGFLFAWLAGAYYVFSLHNLKILFGVALLVPALTAWCSLSAAVDSRRYEEWGSLEIET